MRLNTNTGKIVGFVQRDTLRSEATLEPTVVSRWLSVDPVVHPYESPYVAFANNPILFMDTDGRKIVWATDDKSQKFKGYLDEYRKSVKAFDLMYRVLDTSETTFNVALNSQEFENYPSHSGHFYRNNGAIIFNPKMVEPESYSPEDQAFGSDYYAFGISTVAEEFFHAYQLLTYGDDLSGSINKMSFEFEAKIFSKAISFSS